MLDTDERIALRIAAKDLIDTVVNDTQTPYYSRVAIVPKVENTKKIPNTAREKGILFSRKR